MNSTRIIGVALLAAGIAALVVGMNASHSFADSVSNTFTGRFTQTTTWYIIGGIAAGVVGLLMVLLGVRGKNA